MACLKGKFLPNEVHNSLSESHSQCWDNINVTPQPGAVRILLFRECRFRDRQLLFDSHCNKLQYPAAQENNVSSKNMTKNCDEFNTIIEMIFGSTALKYYDSYYKVHDTIIPTGVIFTQVFSMPMCLKLPVHLNFFGSHQSLQSSMSSFNCDSFGNLSTQTSFGTRADSFSIFRKNTWTSNATSSTLDSGFSESSFQQFSSHPSYGSFTRRDSEELNRTSFSSCNSLVEPSEYSSNFSKKNYSRLGLALIIPKCSKNNLNNIYMDHITFIESILWRIRQYAEFALNSPHLFLNTMREISYLTSTWLSKELSFWTDTHSEDTSRVDQKGFFSTLKKMFSLNRSIFFRNEKDEHFDNFGSTLNELDAKHTKFFLSALLTAVLTHQRGWISTCYQDIDINVNTSYHSIWKQLADLHGASTFIAKTSKIIIYGINNDNVIRKVVEFLKFYIRYLKVRKRDIERVLIINENKIVDSICKASNNEINTMPQHLKKRTLSRTKKLDKDLASMVANNDMFDKTGFFTKTEKDAANGKKQRRIFKTKACENELSMLQSLYEETDCDCNCNEDNNDTSVLFILGDNDKLENLQVSSSVRSDKKKRSITDEKAKNECQKLKIIKFPLPKVKFSENTSEIFPTDFIRCNDFGNFDPDKILQGTNIPEKNWKQILKKDLSLKRSCLFLDEIEENIAVIGNINNWEVQVWSSSRNRLTKTGSVGAIDGGTSTLVSNMLETVSEMWKNNLSRDHCGTFIEHRLLEICLKANAMSHFLLNSDFCSMDTLVRSLSLDITDVPLLMSVGSCIHPDILRKYGISYQ